MRSHCLLLSLPSSGVVAVTVADFMGKIMAVQIADISLGDLLTVIFAVGLVATYLKSRRRG